MKNKFILREKKIYFESRDIWIGIYWSPLKIEKDNKSVEFLDIYICLLPMLPIKLAFIRTNFEPPP